MVPSTRVIAPSLVDRETLNSEIAALYDQLDLQAVALSDYRSLEVVCHDQKLQIDRLEAELRSYVEIAPRLAEYVQRRYSRLWNDHQDLIQRSSDFQKELVRCADRDSEIQRLKTAVFQANLALQREKDRRIHESAFAKDQLKVLGSRLAAAEKSSDDDLRAATTRASKYKKLAYKTEKKLGMARAALEDLQKSFQGHLRKSERTEAELQRLRSDLADRDAEVDHLRAQAVDWKKKCISAVHDRDEIRTQLARLASGALPFPSNVPSADSTDVQTSKRSRPARSSLPTKRPRTSKSTRSGSDRAATPPATPTGDSGRSKRSTKSVRSAKSSVPAETPPASKQPVGSTNASSAQGIASKSPSGSQTGGKRAQKLPAKDLSSSETESFSSTEEDTLAALFGSRSSLQRRGSSSRAPPSSKSAPTPIVVDSPSPEAGSLPCPNRSSPPASRSYSQVNLFGDPSSDSDGSISMNSDPRETENDLLSPDEYSHLPQTQVPRDQWFPGYRARVPRSHLQVHPWSARRVSWTCIAELDVDFLAKHLNRPAGYVFPTPTAPRHRNAPPESDWIPRLVSPAQVLALYQQEPWNQYRSQVVPVSFRATGWFAELASLYLVFEARHRQALWEASHALFLSLDQRERDPDLALLYIQRKQRRSRSGPRWKSVLRFILQGMIDGHCDLDLLLDPFFMHFPSLTEMRPWFPGYGDPQKNIPNLVTALARLDKAEPWRNQFRSRIADHPGSSIARISGKYFPK